MAATTLLTSDQFLAMPEECDDRGNPLHQELIHGEVVGMPHAIQRHSVIQSNIMKLLSAHFFQHAIREFQVFPEMAFVIGDNDTYVPDASVLALSRVNPSSKYFTGAPELAIEVVSPSESASYLRIKTEAYLANGARSVWIVFPEVRSGMVYTHDSLRELKGDQSITDPLLPGFSTPVAAFFELT